MKKLAWLPLLALLFTACTKGTGERYLIFKFKFDPTMPHQNSYGRDTTIGWGNAAQTPTINSIAADYIELSNTDSTKLGSGLILLQSPLFKDYRDSAIDINKLTFTKEGEAFFTIPLTAVAPGTYNNLRLSVAYQNFNVDYKLDTAISSFIAPNGVTYPAGNFSGMFNGTVASFIGYNNYVDKNGIYINTKLTDKINDFAPQGYWALETIIGSGSHNYPALSLTDRTYYTTVVNPFHDKIAMPTPSSIITGAFMGYKYDKTGMTAPTQTIKPLVITGAETESIVIECNLSTNKSFEWRDDISNGNWEPFKGEPVVDMGFRSFKPFIIK